MELQETQDGAWRGLRWLLWFHACLLASGGGGAGGHSSSVFGGDLRQILGSLPFVANFSAADAPAHQTEVEVGIYFEHLFSVSDVSHVFDADFYLSYRWHDPRDYASLFAHDALSDAEALHCEASNTGGTGHRRRPGAGRPAPAPGPAPGPEPGGGADGRSYVELGHDELSEIWTPDLHLRNLYQGREYLHAEMARIYEDGTVEYARFVRATLEIEHPEYYSFPFDHQDLSVQVESLSHMTSRIVLTVWPEMMGMEESNTHEWPGWDYDSHDEETSDVRPDYTHQSPCRAERRSRVTFHLVVHRHFLLYVTSVFLPTILLVVTSWAAPYIRITELMPRVATGFISFLNLNNWISSHASSMPTVNYDIWFTIFMDVARFSIVLSMLESVAAQYLYDRVSSRTSLALDAWARVVFPLNFVAVMAALFSQRRAQEVTMMHRITVANFACVILLSVGWVVWRYCVLRRCLGTEPFKIYGDGSVPFDVHEVKILFKDIDGEEGDHAATVEQAVEWLIERCHLKGQLTNMEKATIVAHLEKKLGLVLTPEIFFARQRTIFVDFRAWDRERHLGLMEQKRQSLGPRSS